MNARLGDAQSHVTNSPNRCLATSIKRADDDCTNVLGDGEAVLVLEASGQRFLTGAAVKGHGRGGGRRAEGAKRVEGRGGPVGGRGGATGKRMRDRGEGGGRAAAEEPLVRGEREEEHIYHSPNDEGDEQSSSHVYHLPRDDQDPHQSTRHTHSMDNSFDYDDYDDAGM
jgi:hypothetical protein